MDLLDNMAQPDKPLGPGAILLHGFASGIADAILSSLHDIVREAPFRQMTTPGGWQMSVAMTNCGVLVSEFLNQDNQEHLKSIG